MDPKLILIATLIIIFLILILLYVKKMWIFKLPDAIKIDLTKEGQCRTDLQECTCPIEIEKKNGTVENKIISNYKMEKDYYKVKQDLMPMWSNFSECNSYGIKKRYRIKGEYNKFDMFDQFGNKELPSTKDDADKYKVYSCDLIPCENYGLDDDNKSICRIRSDGKNFDEIDTDDDFYINTASCDPIVTFQSSNNISQSCVNGSSRLPFLNVDFDLESDILKGQVTNSIGNYNSFREINNVKQPVSIGGNYDNIT